MRGRVTVPCLFGVTTNQKLSPRAGKVDTKWPKGEWLKAAECCEMFPLSLAYGSTAPPPAVASLVRFIYFSCISALFYIIINISAYPDAKRGRLTTTQA